MNWIKDMFKGMGIAMIVVSVMLIFVGLFFIPFAYIWSINTLFGLGLAYTFKNWAAMVALGVFIRGLNGSVKTKEK